MEIMIPEIESYGASDLGFVRPNNEDIWIEMPEQQFYALADGMGGHNAGEVAAKEAILELCDSIDTLFEQTKEPSCEQAKEALLQGIINANQWVRSLSKEHCSLTGMGTTLCCFLVLKNNLIYTHLGDSRIYLFRKKLLKLTEDHTTVQQFLDKNSRLPKMKTVITKAIGPCLRVEPEIKIEPLENNDTLLLCSDGLSDCVSDKEIEAILEKTLSLRDSTHILIDLAKERGGRDNITVVLVKVQRYSS